jgi:uncharacterized protein DUF1553
LNRAALDRAGGGGLAALAEAYQRVTLEAIDRWKTHTMTDDDIALVNWLLENGLLDDGAASKTERTADDENSLLSLVERYHVLEAALPAPQRAPAIADGTGEDEFVFLRGNYRTTGELAPRDLPEVLRVSSSARNATQGVESRSSAAGPYSSGSGRLALAQRLADPSNPLLPRVLVNRLWQHHFGEGIVRTPDDFGRMGQPPTHPELLDYLAAEFGRDWSIKHMTRRMVTSNTYRQGSRNSDFKSQLSNLPADTPQSAPGNPHLSDPDNRLLHRMPIRRLEAEAIRDSILAVSGRLNDQLHGPSVLPFLTPYMEGRGKPQSGPLDGEGRRSLYINARRNFLTPLLLAFDYPVTFTPIGRRGTSSIAGQALTLMNDPFVVGEARRWAERTLAESGSTTEQRIEGLYLTAFARPPSTEELASAIDFLQEQSLRYSGGSDDPRVWADLCHVLMNVKEFIFIE